MTSPVKEQALIFWVLPILSSTSLPVHLSYPCFWMDCKYMFRATGKSEDSHFDYP